MISSTTSITEYRYEFDCTGVTYHIVRLPCKGYFHDYHLVQYCYQLVGEPGHHKSWFLGGICTRFYQEFWFRDQSQAVNFILTWG